MTPEKLADLLGKALKHDPAFTLQDVVDAVASGLAVPIMTENAVNIVQLFDHRDGQREAYIWLGGCEPGHHHEMQDELLPRVETWARENGAHFVEMRSPRAFKRVLKRSGYAVHDAADGVVTLRKPL